MTWIDEKFCLKFRLQEFIGRMTRIKDRYWIETDNFIESSNIPQNLQTKGIQGTKYPNVKTAQSTLYNPSLSRFEIYPIAKPFVENQNHYIQHNMKTSLLHIQMVLI